MPIPDNSTSAELATDRTSARRSAAAFVGGAVVGTVGGLIGLGGAEFRLPLLISAFRYAPLEAIILNIRFRALSTSRAHPDRVSRESMAAHLMLRFSPGLRTTTLLRPGPMS